MQYRYHMSQATSFLSQINAQLIFHLLNDNYGDKMKTYPNFVTIFKQKMGNIHAAKSGSSNLIEMNKILLAECSRLLNERQYDPPPTPQKSIQKLVSLWAVPSGGWILQVIEK